MSPSQPTCTHERGRGTTVCLRCRHEHSQASQRRRQKFFMQFLGLAAVSAIVGVAGVATANTLRDKASATATSEGAVTMPEPPVVNAAPPVSRQTAETPPAVVLQAAERDTTPAPVAPIPARPATHGGFVLIEGRTKLADSVYAVRAGDSVTVNFDAYGFRTRRSTKIENSLRLTLPLVFGRTATASLDTLGPGELVTNRDVVGSLASQGMQLTLDNGAVVRIRVLTRVVSDGPIAIGYLATIER